MFFDIFNALCKERGVSCKRAAMDVGLSNSIPTKWKSTGATPHGDTLSSIAAYFSVTTDYLLGKEQKEMPTPVSESEHSDDELVKLWQHLTPDEILRVKDFVQGMIANRKEPHAHEG